MECLLVEGTLLNLGVSVTRRVHGGIVWAVQSHGQAIFARCTVGSWKEAVGLLCEGMSTCQMSVAGTGMARLAKWRFLP